MTIKKVLSAIPREVANCPLVKGHLEKSSLNPRYLANFLLLGGITKDVFAYTMRVNNAKKNPEIPDDKKPFVIAMDKATGVTTTVVQLVTGTAIASDKFQNFCTSRLFADIADDAKRFKMAKLGFAAISTLFGAVVLAKRIVVPLIATPLASYFMPKGLESGKGESPTGSDVVRTQSRPTWFTT